MIWAKRRFAYADYSPYQDTLEQLLMANPNRYQEFLMVAVRAGDNGASDCYVGLPSSALLAPFDGFREVSEAALPSEIDTFLFGDQTKEPFTSRFKFKQPLGD